MTPARRGSLVGATWLIGLGVIFLIREATDLSWDQLWPLFVILAGVASLVSRLFGWSRFHGPWAFTWSVAWIVVGVVLLLSTTGTLRPGPGELIAEWWPWAAIVLGVWFLLGAFLSGHEGPVESLAIPLEASTDASVRIRYGAGELTTGRAAPGHLVDGTCTGGVDRRRHGVNRVELLQDTSYGLPWFDHPSAWTLGLTGELPLDLRVETGASRATIDLRELHVRSLDLQTGASETRVLLPQAAGATTVHARAGVASLILEVPQGVAARIMTRVAIGTRQIDEARFPRIGDLYQSLDYATCPNRVDIAVEGGVGSVRVVSGPSAPTPLGVLQAAPA